MNYKFSEKIPFEGKNCKVTYYSHEDDPLVDAVYKRKTIGYLDAKNFDDVELRVDVVKGMLERYYANAHCAIKMVDGSTYYITFKELDAILKHLPMFPIDTPVVNGFIALRQRNDKSVFINTSHIVSIEADDYED